MDFRLSDEQEMFRKSVRDFVNRELPKSWARELEKDEHTFPHELFGKLAGAGFHAIGIAEEYGGQGGDIMTQMLLAREATPALAVIERLVGLQAQLPRPPFVQLWSRIAGFQREELRSLIAGDETEIYLALGLPFTDPELREGRGELELALKGKLPKLVNDQDLRGILHCHTDASDGTETLETMAKATRQRGFEYFGVADHSKSAHYAGGLSVEEIAQQHREADRLNLQRVHIDVISVASDKGIETKGVRAQRGRNGTA